MKKIVIFLVIILTLVVIVAFSYINYNSLYNSIKKDNLEFEQYDKKELYGTDIATLINKAINNNIKNNVKVNSDGKYIENEENSIRIDIYISDNNTTYDMETIYNGGIAKFVQNYNIVKFKCTKIEYHNKTKRIKKVYIEQISE